MCNKTTEYSIRLPKWRLYAQQAFILAGIIGLLYCAFLSGSLLWQQMLKLNTVRNPSIVFIEGAVGVIALITSVLFLFISIVILRFWFLRFALHCSEITFLEEGVNITTGKKKVSVDKSSIIHILLYPRLIILVWKSDDNTYAFNIAQSLFGVKNFKMAVSFFKKDEKHLEKLDEIESVVRKLHIKKISKICKRFYSLTDT